MDNITLYSLFGKKNAAVSGDTNNYITDFGYFCNNNRRIDDLNHIDTSKGDSFTYMFLKCSSLTNIPLLDTSSGTDFSYMFSECAALTTIPPLNTNKGRLFTNMFKNCSSLITVPPLDTGMGEDLKYMFNGCSALTTVQSINLNNSTSANYMFSACQSLTELYLYNIKTSITIGSGTTYGHLLTLDSLIHTFNELIPGTGLTLTMGNANIEKITGLYCKVVDITDGKLPMELCVSTDEGAMLVTEYIRGKGWQYA